ncbi:hypothetical protein DOTSEDRAFT_71052 [Dothistroma septosporum NZE10]|uniref:Uncharacterized protein n=1 Tax=Dothistroma septosporum (strain NZE10 / CBS 128990) TaxID=675120 RepID=N1PP59_DOTSN|nr:hypothetical protein DOTSEDRAFT_71052 [Dothistroma septosporum NZE10]
MENRVHVPVNATYLTLACTTLLSLIYLGSNAAFNAILSLQLSSLMASAFIATTCVMIRKLRDRSLCQGQDGLLDGLNSQSTLLPCFIRLLQASERSGRCQR